MRVLRAVLASAVTMLVLDLLWIGVVAAPVYKALLGPLLAPQANALAAGIFYVFYLSFVVWQGALASRTVGEAAQRGALMGLFAYGTWDLTNWAVIAGFPAALVPIDMAWGVGLTALTATVGRAAAGPAPA